MYGGPQHIRLQSGRFPDVLIHLLLCKRSPHGLFDTAELVPLFSRLSRIPASPQGTNFLGYFNPLQINFRLFYFGVTQCFWPKNSVSISYLTSDHQHLFIVDSELVLDQDFVSLVLLLILIPVTPQLIGSDEFILKRDGIQHYSSTTGVWSQCHCRELRIRLRTE